MAVEAQRQPSFQSSTEILRELPLCASDSYYERLVMSRPPIYRGIRWLSSRFFLNVFGSAGLLVTQAKKVGSAVLDQGLGALSPASIGRTQTWHYIVSHQLLIAIAALIFVAFIPFGFRMRDDVQREAVETRKREQGLRLAAGYRAYLEHIRATLGELPLVVQGVADPDSGQSTAEKMIFAQLTLTPRAPAAGAIPVVETTEKSTQTRELRASRMIRLLEPRRDVHHGASETYRPDGILSVNNGIMALNRTRAGAILILGQPGSGKTTLLRNLAWIEARNQLLRREPGGRVPMFIDLSIYQLTSDSMKQIIDKQVRDVGGLDDDIAARISQAIQQGPSLILIDGLDEMLGDKRKAALDQINKLGRDPQRMRALPAPIPLRGRAFDPVFDPVRELFSRPPTKLPAPAQATNGAEVSVQLAIGSRVATYQLSDLNPQLFETWDLLPITDPPVQLQLIRQVIDAVRHPKDGAIEGDSTDSDGTLDPQALLSQLNRQTQTLEWTTSPLLLTLATIEWIRSGGTLLATTRTALYQRAIDGFLRLRTKDWTDNERFQIQQLIDLVALRMFRLGWRSLTRERYYAEIEPGLPETFRNGNVWQSAHIGTVDVLVNSSGLFRRNGRGQYDIYHVSFLEYLAARSLARNLVTLPRPIDLEGFLAQIRSRSIASSLITLPTTDNDTEDALTILWPRRLRDRWGQIQVMLIGILTELPTDLDGSFGGFDRPDLAVAWIRALFDQREDSGNLGLRKAAACVAQLTVDTDDAREVAHDIAERLAGRLRAADAAQDRASVVALQQACAAMADGKESQGAILSALDSRPADSHHLVFTETMVKFTVVQTKNAAPLRTMLLYDRGDPEIRISAARMYEQRGADALPALADLRNRLEVDPDPRVREACALAIGAIGPAAIPALPRLLDLLDYPNIGVQVAAARAIGRMGRLAAGCVPVLVACLFDAHSVVRDELLKTIGSLGAAGVPVLSLLESRLTNPAAVRAIGALGIDAVSAVPRLLERMKSKDPNMRLATTDALGMIALAGGPTLTNLVGLLDDHDRRVRKAAASYIGQMGGQALPVWKALLKSLGDPDDAVSAEAADAVSALGRAGAPVLDDLRALASNTSTATNSRERIAAARALGSLGESSPQLLSTLLSFLQDSDERIRTAGANAFRLMGPAGAAAIPGLCQLLDDPFLSVRLAAAAAVQAMGRQMVVVKLDFSDFQFPLIRMAAIRAVGTLGDSAASALPQLLNRLLEQSEQMDIRLAAAHAIRGIGPLADSVKSELGTLLAGQDMLLTAATSPATDDSPDHQIKIVPPSRPGTGSSPERDRGKREVDALIRSHNDANVVDSLILLCAREDIHVQLAAVEVLAEQGAMAAAAAPTLVAHLADPQVEMRRLAIEAIGKVCESSQLEEFSLALRDALADEDATVRDQAAVLLAKARMLTTYLSELQVAITAGYARGIYEPVGQRAELDVYVTLGNAAQQFESRMVMLFAASHWTVRERAARALGSLRRVSGETERRLVAAQRNDPSLAVRDAAEDALERIYSEDPDVIEIAD